MKRFSIVASQPPWIGKLLGALTGLIWAPDSLHWKPRIEPGIRPKGLQVNDWDGDLKGQVTALVSRLPEEIGERECELIRRKAGWQKKQSLVH